MPSGLKRFQRAESLHFIPFSCFHRLPLLEPPGARETVEAMLEQTRALDCLPFGGIAAYTVPMDNERIRAICMGLPHVTETLNWGHHLVYFVGDKEIGGRMFAMTDLDGTGYGVLCFHCGAERFHELLEREGIGATPYLTRAFWVTVERWDVLRAREYEEELGRAYALIYEKLPKRTKTVLAMPEKERGKIIRERKKVVAARAKAKKG